jgi:hypothetical protein
MIQNRNYFPLNLVKESDYNFSIVILIIHFILYKNLTFLEQNAEVIQLQK